MAVRKFNLLDNPFITGPIIPNELFCDREMETAKLYGYIANGNNVVLKSARRIGKTSLIHHLFQVPEIAKNYNTILVDLYQTKNLQGLVTRFSRALLEAPFARTQRGLKSLTDAIPEIKLFAQLNAGPVTAGMEAIYKTRYETTLDTIFDFLKKSDKRNLVVFDEFQTIEDYDDTKVSAMLRSGIQSLTNTEFIFSGSEKHMLASMFLDRNKPFYKSALQMEIDVIPYEAYRAFCRKMFKSKQRDITDDAIDLTYHLFTANTFEMQTVMNLTFSFTAKGQTANVNDVKLIIENIISENESAYREIFNSAKTEKESNFFLCLGIEGIASALTSEKMIGKYMLGGASSVQNTIKKYSKEDPQTNKKAIIEEIGNKNYKLMDKFFELWIAQNTGRLEEKYATARERFSKEQTIRKAVPKLILPPSLQ